MSSRDSARPSQHALQAERQSLLARIEQEVKARHQLSKQILANEEESDRQAKLFERRQKDQENRIEQYATQLSRAQQTIEEQERYIQEERNFRHSMESRAAALLSKNCEDASKISECLTSGNNTAKQESADSELLLHALPRTSTPSIRCDNLCQHVQWCPTCGPPRVLFISITDDEEYYAHQQQQSDLVPRQNWRHERMKMLLESRIATDANQSALEGLNQQVLSLHTQLAEAKAEICRLQGQMAANQMHVHTPSRVDEELQAEMDALKRQIQSLVNEKELLRTAYEQNQDELARLRQLQLVKSELVGALDGLRMLSNGIRTFERQVHKSLDSLSEKCDRALILISAKTLWRGEREVRRSSWKLCVFKDVVVTATAPSRRDPDFDDENGSATYDVEKRLAALSFASRISRVIMTSAKALECYKEWVNFVQNHILQVCSMEQSTSEIHDQSPLSKEVFTQVMKGGLAALFELCPGLILEAKKTSSDAGFESPELDSEIVTTKQSIEWKPKLQMPTTHKSLNWKSSCAVGGFDNIEA